MFDNKNPVLIQETDTSCRGDAIPLVLIHDGGGTVFSYYCLGHLGRKVYGISNPRFFSGRPWTGGITQMCKLYVKLIQTVIPHGKILIGGWSFGGIISMELAKQLSQTNITVAGIIMIDSPCPLAFKDKAKLECRPVVPHTPASRTHTRPEMKLMVARCMKQAGDLLHSWDIPEFAPRRYTSRHLSRATKAKVTTVTVTEIELAHDSSSESSSDLSSYSDESLISSRRSSNTSYYSEQEHDSESVTIISTMYPSKSSKIEAELDLDMLNYSLLPRLPSVALLRCSDYVPTATSSPSPSPNPISDALANGVCKVDITRDMPCLGWKDHDARMLSYTQDIPGHHFNIFEADYVQRTTKEIRDACLWLERNE